MRTRACEKARRAVEQVLNGPAPTDPMKTSFDPREAPQQPNDTVQLRAGRRSQLNVMPGVVKFAALLPATDRGYTTPLTAEPATNVPGVTSRSRPTVPPLVDVPGG